MLISITALEEKKTLVCERLIRQIPHAFHDEKSIRHYATDIHDMQIFLANTNQRKVGFVALRNTAKETTEIHLIAVLKAYQKCGIGTQLIESAQHYSLALKHKQMIVRVPSSSPLEATHFYMKHGFSKLMDIPQLWRGQAGELLVKTLR